MKRAVAGNGKLDFMRCLGISDKMKILLVEDDASVAEMAKELLTNAGCETSVVHTGKAGIELASEKKFDLIVLDIDLPDINGFDICRDLKQRHLSHRTPVVFISGRLLDEDRQRGLDLGAVDYIAKPFVGVDLVSRLLSHVKVKPRGNLASVALSD